MSKTQVKSNDRFSKLKSTGQVFYNFAVCGYDDYCIDRASSSTSYRCGILF